MSDNDTPQETQGLEAPTHTQTPNSLFDVYMKDMSESELRVVLCAVRKTFGYHKQRDPISLTQFQRMTGMSRQGVLDGIERAVKRGLLIPVGLGTRNVTIYELNVTGQQSGLVKQVDQSKSLTRTSQASRPELVKQVDTQKKSSKENKQKKSTPRKKIERPVGWLMFDAVYDGLGLASIQGGIDMANLLEGKSKTHENITPPMDADEFESCVRWCNPQYRPSTVDGVIRLAKRWRASNEWQAWRHNNRSVPALKSDVIPDEQPEPPTLTELMRNAGYEVSS